MPAPAHLNKTLTLEFNNRSEALNFLLDLRTHFTHSGQNGYICLTGGDTVWDFANKHASTDDPVKFVCPAQYDVYDSLNDEDFIAQVHLYNQGLAEETKKFRERVFRFKDKTIDPKDRLESVKGCIEYLLEQMEEGKIPKAVYKPPVHKRPASDTVKRVIRISYDITFIEEHARKFGRNDPGHGTQQITLDISSDSCDSEFNDFIALYKPPRPS